MRYAIKQLDELTTADLGAVMMPSAGARIIRRQAGGFHRDSIAKLAQYCRAIGQTRPNMDALELLAKRIETGKLVLLRIPAPLASGVVSPKGSVNHLLPAVLSNKVHELAQLALVEDIDRHIKNENSMQQSGGHSSAPAVIAASTASAAPVSSRTMADAAAETTFIELEYLYQDSDPVQNAPYKVTLSDGSILEGSLDETGKARLDDVVAGSYKVTLGEDTRDYQAVEEDEANPLYGKITPASAVAMVESGDTSLLDEAGDIAANGGNWLWGTLQGDFNATPSTSQIAVGSIISMIPVVDQVMDVRDVIANAMLLTDDTEANDTDGWIALTLTGIGFVPVLGSAVKGVGKVIVANADSAVSMAAAALRKMGKGDPVKFIKGIDWDGMGKQGAALIKDKVNALQESLTGILDSWTLRKLIPDESLNNLQNMSNQLAMLGPKIDSGIAQGTAEIKAKVSKALKEYEGELPHSGATGKLNKVKTVEKRAPEGNKVAKGDGKVHPLKAKMKSYKVPCFTPGNGPKKRFNGNNKALENNYARQLKHQQDGLNDLSIGEYLENRARYKDMKRQGTGSAQTDFRKKFSVGLTKSLNKNYSKSMSPIEAKAKAKIRSKEIMDDLAALHDPDMGAGGYDKVSRMGNRSINSSIGPQWSQASKNKKSRVQLMDEQVEKALKQYGPDAKLNIELARCPLTK